MGEGEEETNGRFKEKKGGKRRVTGEEMKGERDGKRRVMGEKIK